MVKLGGRRKDEIYVVIGGAKVGKSIWWMNAAPAKVSLWLK